MCSSSWAAGVWYRQGVVLTNRSPTKTLTPAGCFRYGAMRTSTKQHLSDRHDERVHPVVPPCCSAGGNRPRATTCATHRCGAAQIVPEPAFGARPTAVNAGVPYRGRAVRGPARGRCSATPVRTRRQTASFSRFIFLRRPRYVTPGRSAACVLFPPVRARASSMQVRSFRASSAITAHHPAPSPPRLAKSRAAK